MESNQLSARRPWGTGLLLWVMLQPGAGCGVSEMIETSGSLKKSGTPEKPALPSPIVSVDWLLEHENDERLVILDVRPREQYLAGHIPGARSLPCIEESEQASAIANMAPIQTINRVLGDIGIDRHSTVVIYGDGDYRLSARVFWVLEVHGHPAVAVLDGGLTAWRRHGDDLQSDIDPWTPREFVSVLRPELFVDKLSMYRALADDSVMVIDGRTPQEYRGISHRGDRKGHIPTAMNYDARANLSDDPGYLRSRAELTELYAALAPAKKIYAYCHMGWLAAVDYLILRTLGHDVAVYDGSWDEWSSDASLPIVMGERAGARREL